MSIFRRRPHVPQRPAPVALFSVLAGSTGEGAAAADGVATAAAVGASIAEAVAASAGAASVAGVSNAGEGVGAAAGVGAASAVGTGIIGGVGSVSLLRRALALGGTADDQEDRLRFPLTTNAGASSTAINVGAADFTYELWLRCAYADNTTTATDVRFSNIVLDRDIWDHVRGHCPLGVTRRSGVLVLIFGANNGSGAWPAIRGTTQVGDGAWHHVAVVRDGSTVRLFLDGVQDASGTFSTADWSYPLSYTPTGGQDNEYLVLGAEKHDFDPGVGGFDGEVDELRISDTARYTSGFTAPSAPLSVDGDTVGLYHFDEGAGTAAADSASGVTGELLVGAGGPTWITDTPFPLVQGVGVALAVDDGAAAASGVATASAVGASTAAGVWASAGVGAASAVGASTAASVGAAAGAGTAEAVSAATAASVAAAAGVGAASGVGASDAASVAASAGVGAASGVGASTAEAVWASAGAASVAGVGSATGGTEGVADAAGVATAEAVGASTAEAVGAAAGVGAGAGVGASIAEAVASAGGASSPLGVGASWWAAAGQAQGVATAEAVGEAAGSVGAAAGAASVAGVGAAIVAAVAAGAGAATVTGVSPTIGTTTVGLTLAPRPTALTLPGGRT